MLPFTLQQLRILKAIATEKNFTRAAASLYISQPSLSKQIKILEENLDTILINREKNNISLTESGRIFLQYSERILILCEESCRALIDLKKGDRGNLKVGASQTIGTYLMPRILALFAQNYPQIDLKVQVDSTRTISNSIIKREIDIVEEICRIYGVDKMSSILPETNQRGNEDDSYKIRRKITTCLLKFKAKLESIILYSIGFFFASFKR